MKGPRPLAPHTAPALWGSARQGEGTAVSIYLTGPHSPRHGREGSGGRNTTPWSPGENLRVPGALERAAWGGGTGPSQGRKPVTSPLSRRRPRSALRGLHRSGSGEQGTSLSPFPPPSPRVTFTALSPATGPTRHTYPLKKHGDPTFPVLPARSHAAPMCLLTCVRVCVCLAVL